MPAQGWVPVENDVRRRSLDDIQEARERELTSGWCATHTATALACAELTGVRPRSRDDSKSVPLAGSEERSDQWSLSTRYLERGHAVPRSPALELTHAASLPGERSSRG